MGLLLVGIILLLTFYSSEKEKKKIDKHLLIFYLAISILFFEWFYNHPSLRYGGYSLIALLIFIPFSIYLSKFISIKFFKDKIIFLIVLSLIIFVGRNLNRIGNEIKKYNYNFFSEPYYQLNKTHFRVDKFLNSLFLSYENCTNKDKINCQSFNGLLVNKKNIYYILKKDK